MVVIKYSKTDEGAFFSHLNMLRLWNRILSIADIDVKYTEGFNKTRRIYFSSPTRVGVESLAEYIVIDTQESKNKVESKIENVLPSWMKVLKVYQVENKFNIASLNSQAKYKISFDGYKNKIGQIQDFFNKKELITPVIAHGEKRQIDVKDRIYEVVVNDKSLELKCGVGNNSVRIDEVVKLLLQYLGIPQSQWTIVKEELYLTNQEGIIEEVDRALETLKKD